MTLNNNKLKVVIDTNVLLVSILENFKYFRIFEDVQSNKVDLFVSNEILTEYTEIFSKRLFS